ncbi:DUF1841 family protein [Thiosocius teredinicola]|uniref:DUF1841 family protein n=1 Tax=Thiosocius teredinicola TaxID=1973002 RepID=UPI000990B79A
MFGQNRDELRRFFRQAWEKRTQGLPLQPLEQLVAQVIELHPEYHRHLADERQLQRDFTPDDGETNPWLHMGMHITLGEQVASDRPPGIRTQYQQLVKQFADQHAAEHAMMDCLGVVLWEAQRAGSMPDEAAYLECLRKLSK